MSAESPHDTKREWLDSLGSTPTPTNATPANTPTTAKAEGDAAPPSESHVQRMANLKEKLDTYNQAISEAIGGTSPIVPPSMGSQAKPHDPELVHVTTTTTGTTGGGSSPVHTLRSPFTNNRLHSQPPAGATTYSNGNTTPLRPPGFPMPSPGSQGGSPVFSPTRITVTDASVVKTTPKPTQEEDTPQPIVYSEESRRGDDDEETSPVRSATETLPTPSPPKSVSPQTREIRVSGDDEEEGDQKMVEEEEEELSLEQLENARFTIDLLQDTLTAIVDKQGAFTNKSSARTPQKHQQSYFDPLAHATAKTTSLMGEYQAMLQAWDEHPFLNAVALAAYDDQSKADFSAEVSSFYGECDSVKPHFEPIYAVQRRQQETERKIRAKLDDLQHKQRRFHAERRKTTEIRDKNTVVDRALSHNETDTKRQMSAFEVEGQFIEKRKAALEKREQRVGQWLRILEDRDEALGDKESALRIQLTDAARKECELLAEKENIRRRSDYAGSFKDPHHQTGGAAPHFPSKNSNSNSTPQHQSPAPTNLRQQRQARAATAAAKFGATYEPHQQSIIRDDEEEDEDEPNFEQISEDNDHDTTGGAGNKEFAAYIAGGFAPSQVIYDFEADDVGTGTTSATPSDLDADATTTETGETTEEEYDAGPYGNVYMAPSRRGAGGMHDQSNAGAGEAHHYTFTPQHHQHVGIDIDRDDGDGFY